MIPRIAASRLPTFFIIGAAKCGTTSLYTDLDAHPDVSMTSRKEPNIFSEPAYRSLLPRYEAMLDPTAEARAEASVIYSQHSARPEVPERIHSVLPEARFIYLVRDPIDRAVSEYVYNLAVGKERRPIDEALADLDQPFNPYTCASRYATRLRSAAQHAPRTAATDRPGTAGTKSAATPRHRPPRTPQCASQAGCSLGRLGGRCAAARRAAPPPHGRRARG